jgi:hypothetical protein
MIFELIYTTKRERNIPPFNITFLDEENIKVLDVC